jgi:hypothetical protein
MLPLLIAGLIVLGVAAVIGAGVAIGKLIEAGKDADANFFDCPVGSPSGTCPAKALSEHGKTEVKQAMADAKAMLEKTKKDLKPGISQRKAERRNGLATRVRRPAKKCSIAEQRAG